MYRIIELQSTENSMSMIDHGERADYNEACSVLHSVSQYSSISTVPVHTVEIINSEGTVVKKEVYKHTPAPVETQEGGEE